MQTDRLDWLDIAKGIAIILVVYGHASRGLEVAGLISFNDVWGYIDYLIYTVHMPVFFVVSGFLYERGLKKAHAAGPFLLDKVITIVWPYFLWTTLFVSIQTMMSGTGVVNSDASLGRLTTIGWNPVSPFWFLYALFVAFVISFALQRVAIGVVTAAAFAMMHLGYWLTTAPLLFDLTYGLFYFSLGRFVYAKRLSDLPRADLLLVVAVTGFGITATFAYLTGLHVRLETIGTLAGLVVLCLLSKRLAATALNRPLVILGRCTMGIYVMHIFVIATFRGVGMKVLDLSPISIIIGCTILAVVLPVIAQIVANKLDIGKILGLKTKLDDVV